MRIAIIENNEVVNVIISDEIPVNGIECDDIVCVNWNYLDGEFIAPPLNQAVEIAKAEIGTVDG